ncbi:MAG: hypothetical protein ACJA2M_001255 [Polaribacter sp.]|jgi:hypothetical protein
MKKNTLILTVLIVCQISYAQIEIDDKSKEPEIKAIKYNGEFMSFDGIYEEEKKAGVAGELVTLIDVSTYNIYENEDNLKSRKNISYKLEELFANKTFEIIDYNYDLYDILKIKNDSSTYIWKVSSTDKYVFNKYIDNVKEKYEGKTFIPLHKDSEFEAIDGSKFNIEGEKKYRITKVKFAKLQFDYGIVFNLNDSFECVFPNGTFAQPTLFNGKIYTTDENYINIASNDIFKSKVMMIEEAEFNSFSSKNKTYLTKIRKKEVQIGMTEKQCRFSWGTPSNSMSNIGGYNTVLIYGETGNSQNLYFKKGILKLLK